MAITFEEIKQYLARNVRLSICFEDGHYHNYLIVSDIPDQKYERLYVYGIGMVDVEFPKDIYTNPQEPDGIVMASRDDKLEPAIEILLHEESREIERSTDETLVFKDLKSYLQIGKHFSIVNREDWSYETYEYRDDIPEKYDDMYVYGIGMEDNPDIEKMVKEWENETYLKKRMVIVLSSKNRPVTNAELRESRKSAINSVEEIGVLNVDFAYAKWITTILKTYMKHNINDLSVVLTFEGKQYTVEDAVNEIVSIADEYIDLRNATSEMETEKDLISNFKYAGRLFTEVMPYLRL